MEKSPLFKILVQNHNRKHKKYRFLAKTKGPSTLTSSTYILFLTKLQKRQTLWNGFAFFENDITQFYYRHETCVL